MLIENLVKLAYKMCETPKVYAFLLLRATLKFPQTMSPSNFFGKFSILHIVSIFLNQLLLFLI